MKTKYFTIMKKLFFQFLILVSISLTCNISTNAQQKIAAFKDNNGLWGYINIKGDIVVQPKYSTVKLFSSDGLALVREKKSKKYYYINTQGENLQLDCSPERYGNFSDGRAMVRIGDTWGYIDTNGKLVITPKYTKATDFISGKAIVQISSGKVLLIDKSGNETDLSGLNIKGFKEFSEGLARVQVNSGTWGYINTDGRMAIEAKYLRAGDFSAGLAWVRVGEKQDGYIDKTGKLAIDPKYITVKDFDPVSGIALVKNQSEQWIYINKEGAELQVDAKKFNDFKEGLCAINTLSNPEFFGFIGKDGKWIIEPKYAGTSDFNNGVCRVRVNKLWGVIDKQGNMILEPKYIGLHDFAQVE